MRLRDEFDQIVQEKNARQKKEEDIQSRDLLLCEEVRGLYKRYPGEKLDGMYDYSLPVQLPPESRALVDELISLCPPAAWKRVPSAVDPSEICYYSKPNYDYGYRYHTDSHYLQYRLPDGSVHIGQIELSVEEGLIYVKEPFRLTTRGQAAAREAAQKESERLTKELVFRKAQQALEETITRNPMLVDSREYIDHPFSSGMRYPWSDYGDTFVNYIVIFRDGTVYDPYPMRQNEDRFHRPLASSASYDFIRQICSAFVRKWAEMA